MTFSCFGYLILLRDERGGGVTTEERFNIPVITVDGLPRVGKWTLGNQVALRLGFHRMSTGMIYRAIAWKCMAYNSIDPERVQGVARAIRIRMRDGAFCVDDVDITDELRSSDDIGEWAARISQLEGMANVVHAIQLESRRPPGLVIDGCDSAFRFQGLVFRVFLKTSLETRVGWRLKQLKLIDQDVPAHVVRNQIYQRDCHHMTREVSPVVCHPEALQIDTSNHELPQIRERVITAFMNTVVR